MNDIHLGIMIGVFAAWALRWFINNVWHRAVLHGSLLAVIGYIAWRFFI